MIKRNTHLFTRQREFQDFLDTMEEDTSIAHYSVSKDGVHYIITERKMSESEANEFRKKQLKKQIKECNERWERRIKNCEQLMYEYNTALNFEMGNLYMERRNELIEEYNKEQRKLTKALDNLKYSL